MSPGQVACPRCGGLPTMPCRNDGGDTIRYFHQMRIEKSREEASDERAETVPPQGR